jgi:hypothetical protein
MASRQAHPLSRWTNTTAGRHAELPLDDDQRHTFVRELDGLGVTGLMRREAAPYASRGGHLSATCG